ncbi:MAG TPA: GTPase ObgE [Saprospiraceae bacterium]|nr:GTPase ObgE [Saprospiraceae bacterium]HNT22272.1 GTPase ObgE [Saprospiraceae bacterium]
MAEENFIDFVKIQCKSGKGGAGSIHFHRGKYIPRGGPDGGDGGKGGNIIVTGNNQLWTLLHLRYTKHLFAGDGKPGSKANQTGHGGEDMEIQVPLGTVVKSVETGETLAEITHHGEQKTILEGGRGGKGNAFFKSATHQAPRFAQPGEPGVEAWLSFELKILADVGLVGFPNAGKSTLLAALTAAKPKIASYPFTTLVPNLGIVRYRDDKSFVMADIPGIIEGAHEGRGLGLRFLRHIERNAVLLFIVPSDSENISKEFKILVNELNQYSPELMDKPRLLAISKMDLVPEGQSASIKRKIPKGVPYCLISAASGQGLDELRDLLWKNIQGS